MPDPTDPTHAELVARLARAEETLDAIQDGSVDALVVNTSVGPRVYTLQGADDFYRALVEQMVEGAAAVQPDGTVLYANGAMAALCAVPLEALVGSDITTHVADSQRPALSSLLTAGAVADGALLRLGRDESTAVEVMMSAREIEAFDGSRTMCLIASDRRPYQRSEAANRRAELSAERDRVARDLHDVVIQSLFAIGLRLQSITMAVDDEQAQRLGEAIDELDDTVIAIRSTIFGLQSPGRDLLPLSQAIARLIDETPATLGFLADLLIDGAVDRLTRHEIYHDITATLREALSNAARHAQATRVTVAVTLTATDLTLQVIDNGRGLPADRIESGLANLRVRAEKHGGRCTIVNNDNNRGVEVTWRVPIDPRGGQRET